MSSANGVSNVTVAAGTEVEITPEIAAKLIALRDPFPAEYVAYRPQPWCGACSKSPKKTCNAPGHEIIRCAKCKQKVTKAHIDLSYVGHAETTDRLIQSDPTWKWEPQARDIDPQVLAAAAASGNPDVVKAVLESAPPKFDQYGGLWINLTVHGVTKPGYGDAQGKQPGPNAIKEVIGDAIRNAAMRFGVGIDLWSKSDMGELEAARMADRDGQETPAAQNGHQQISTVHSPAPPPVVQGGRQYAQQTQNWFAWIKSQIAAAVDLASLDGLSAIAEEGCGQHQCPEVLPAMRSDIDQRRAAITALVDPETLRTMHIRLSGKGLATAEDRRAAIVRIVGRELGSSKELTFAEAVAVIQVAETAPVGLDLTTGQMVPANAGQPYEPRPGDAGSQWAGPGEEQQ